MTERKDQLAQVEQPQSAAIQQYQPPDVEGTKRGMLAIRQLQSEVLREGIDFGVIPGTPKPTLFKPGAESLLLTFRLAVAEPNVEVEQLSAAVAGHRSYRVSLPIINRSDGRLMGYGEGECSTMETKYRFRSGSRKCPLCRVEAIMKSKAEYGGGWYCFTKKDGCGAQFVAGDPAIENQQTGQVEHQNPADFYNTCLKMAKKRALVDAALTTTGASGVFTQDVEDLVDNGVISPAAQPAARQQQQSKPTGRHAEQAAKTGEWHAVEITAGEVKSNDKTTWINYSFLLNGKKTYANCFNPDLADDRLGTDRAEDWRGACEILLTSTEHNGKTFLNIEDFRLPANGSEPIDADYTDIGTPVDMNSNPLEGASNG